MQQKWDHALKLNHSFDHLWSATTAIRYIRDFTDVIFIMYIVRVNSNYR